MKKKSPVLRFLGWTLLALLVGALAVLPRMARSRAEANSGEVLMSARAERGEIIGTLSGGGTLKADDPLEITVPSGVELTEYLVKNGQRVSAGTPVASVDPVTVMAAAVEVQEALDKLTEQIREASNERATQTLSASSSGRVKAVFVKSGDDVRAAMMNYGCLAVISLDGMMAVEFSTQAALRPGEPVRVAVEGGKTYDGRVETILNGTASVTLTDNGPKLADTVRVVDSAGNEIGSGTLTVHSPLRILAESGTVNKVLVRTDAKVNKDAALLTIRDMDPGAEYESLSAKRREYSDTLRELFTLYRDGAVLAPKDGFVIDTDDTLVKNLSAGEEEFRVVLLDNSPSPSIVPDGTTNEVGLVTAAQGGAAFVIDLGAVQVSDYADLSAVGIDLEAIGSSPAPQRIPLPAYIWSAEKGWEELNTLQPGDIVLIATKGPEKRMIFVRHIDLPQIPTNVIPDNGGSLSPAMTQEELEAMMRERYGDLIGNLPGGFKIPNFTMPTAPQEEEEELYDLEGTVIASLVPDNSMQVSFPVDELDILKYAEGMDAEITVDALPGKTFAGKVTGIGAVGESNGGNSKFTVTVSFDRSPDMLDGMNASVSVRTQTVSGLMIPTAALYDSGSRTYVYTGLDRSGEKPDGRTEVTVGVSDGETAQILSGLEEGQTVWYIWYEGGETAAPVMPQYGPFGRMP